LLYLVARKHPSPLHLYSELYNFRCYRLAIPISCNHREGIGRGELTSPLVAQFDELPDSKDGVLLEEVSPWEIYE
jgi:hypothetical protein